MLMRAAHEGGFQTNLLRGEKIVLVRRNHHHLFGLEIECRHCAQIRFGIGLVVMKRLRRKHAVPRQAAELRHVHQQRGVAVGECGDDVIFLQPLQTFDGVRPRLQAMPHPIQMIFLGFGQIVYFEFHQQVIEDQAMQRVDFGPWQFAARHTIHRRAITRAPCVGKLWPIHAQPACFAPRAAILDDAAAKIDAGAEYVEGERLDVGQIGGHGQCIRVVGGSTEFYFALPRRRCHTTSAVTSGE